MPPKRGGIPKLPHLPQIDYWREQWYGKPIPDLNDDVMGEIVSKLIEESKGVSLHEQTRLYNNIRNIRLASPSLATVVNRVIGKSGISELVTFMKMADAFACILQAYQTMCNQSRYFSKDGVFIVSLHKQNETTPNCGFVVTPHGFTFLGIGNKGYELTLSIYDSRNSITIPYSKRRPLMASFMDAITKESSIENAADKVMGAMTVHDNLKIVKIHVQPDLMTFRHIRLLASKNVSRKLPNYEKRVEEASAMVGELRQVGKTMNSSQQVKQCNVDNLIIEMNLEKFITTIQHLGLPEAG